MLQKPLLPSEAADPQAMLRDPTFQALVRERSSFAWSLSIVMIVVYLAFIFAVAFAHDAMATKIGAGPLTLGIVLGLAVIIFAFALTGIYVARANTRFDDLTRTVVKEQAR
ncbi:DUF485 domain-containing protein [Lichenihabitans psoromatis]|uniref:DUF485 domain-containing protein n=1 Tax=Lichenihabitans psoromatis TaxID=2528642 RepID=UPI001FE22E3F|nr:DUF485 domain-containing protein [Lichenihabitans psoromatis]